MSCNNRRKHEKYFENVDGKEIRLLISCNEKAFVEFLISEVVEEQIKNQSFFVLLLAIINLVLLYTNLFYRIIYILIFIIISLKILQLMSKVKNERLLVVKSLGIQYTVHYYIGSYTTQFIPWDSVEKFFINEVITFQRVLFLLSVMTENDACLIPLFKHTRPRLKCLEIIYTQMQQLFI